MTLNPRTWGDTIEGKIPKYNNFIKQVEMHILFAKSLRK